jgi:hypothetical protein
MFYERLLSLFWEHASFYRAITVDEYKDRWVDFELHEIENKNISPPGTQRLSSRWPK